MWQKITELIKELPVNNDCSWWVENDDGLRPDRKELDSLLRKAKRPGAKYRFAVLGVEGKHCESCHFRAYSAVRESLYEIVGGHSYVFSLREVAIGYEAFVCVATRSWVYPNRGLLGEEVVGKLEKALSKALICYDGQPSHCEAMDKDLIGRD